MRKYLVVVTNPESDEAYDSWMREFGPYAEDKEAARNYQNNMRAQGLRAVLIWGSVV